MRAHYQLNHLTALLYGQSMFIVPRNEAKLNVFVMQEITHNRIEMHNYESSTSDVLSFSS